MIEYDVFHIHEHLSLDANICSLVDFSIRKTAAKKKIKQTTKKLPANSPAKPDPNQRRKVFKRQVATELLKRNPEIVSAVIRQWLREK